MRGEALGLLYLNRRYLNRFILNLTVLENHNLPTLIKRSHNYFSNLAYKFFPPQTILLQNWVVTIQIALQLLFEKQIFEKLPQCDMLRNSKSQNQFVGLWLYICFYRSVDKPVHFFSILVVHSVQNQRFYRIHLLVK